MTKSEAGNFLKKTFDNYSDTRFIPIAMHGTKDLFTLEAQFTVTAKSDGPLLKKGQSVTLPGVSLFRFDSIGKIIMQHDYYCIPGAH
jgi:hypothetical protein